MIENDQEDDTIPRIFAYMAIITCFITIEFLKSDNKLQLLMKPIALRELDEVYRMCSLQKVLHNYSTMIRDEVLFLPILRPGPITLDVFYGLFRDGIENEFTRRLINPEQFRYNYIIDYIYPNRAHLNDSSS